MVDNSIFEEYYRKRKFADRFLEDEKDAVDVIIPGYHTNDLWRANLFSIYREIPVRRLLISDGGCIDNSIEIVKEFPRVEIFDHTGYKTGKVEDTFHYHQNMYRKSKGYRLEVTRLSVQTNTSREERMRADTTQIRGIVKYMDPVEPYVIDEFTGITAKMISSGDLEYREFRTWINQVNPVWNKYFNPALLLKIRLRGLLSKIRKILFG